MTLTRNIPFEVLDLCLQHRWGIVPSPIHMFRNVVEYQRERCMERIRQAEGILLWMGSHQSQVTSTRPFSAGIISILGYCKSRFLLQPLRYPWCYFSSVSVYLIYSIPATCSTTVYPSPCFYFHHFNYIKSTYHIPSHESHTYGIRSADISPYPIIIPHDLTIIAFWRSYSFSMELNTCRISPEYQRINYIKNTHEKNPSKLSLRHIFHSNILTQFNPGKDLNHSGLAEYIHLTL